jgi:hypothetical protein
MRNGGDLRDRLIAACNEAHADRREVIEALVDALAITIVQTSSAPDGLAADVARCLIETVAANSRRPLVDPPAMIN